MGRDLPVECEHGKVVDWGDFGDQPEDCAACRPNRRTPITHDPGAELTYYRRQCIVWMQRALRAEDRVVELELALQQAYKETAA